MKMKYYLRGLGVGLIISSLMFLVAFSFYKPKISDETLKAEAIKRGYTLSEKADGTISSDQKKNEEKTSSKKEDSKKSEKTSESKKQTEKKALEKAKQEAKERVEKAEQKIDDANKQVDEAAKPLDDIVKTLTNTASKVSQQEVKTEKGIKRFVVNSGDSSWTVSKSWKSMGLIDNDKEFDSYLCSNGYSQRINPGTFNIPDGSSYQDIAKIITRSR